MKTRNKDSKKKTATWMLITYLSMVVVATVIFAGLPPSIDTDGSGMTDCTVDGAPYGGGFKCPEMGNEESFRNDTFNTNEEYMKGTLPVGEGL